MNKIATRPVLLTSRRLSLRPLKIADAARLARITNDPLIARNLLRTAMPFTVGDARELILRALRKKSPVWAIDNGQLIGLIGLAGELGYWLARSNWGRGYACEAARLVIDHAFVCLNMEKLYAAPIVDNTASRLVLEKLGFQENGRTHAFCDERDKVVPLIRYTLDRRQWTTT